MDQAQLDEILGYLRHEKVEVRKMALEAVMGYSEHPEVLAYIAKGEMVKAIKACLYDLVGFCNKETSSFFTLVTSQHQCSQGSHFSSGS